MVIKVQHVPLFLRGAPGMLQQQRGLASCTLMKRNYKSLCDENIFLIIQALTRSSRTNTTFLFSMQIIFIEKPEPFLIIFNFALRNNRKTSFRRFPCFLTLKFSKQEQCPSRLCLYYSLQLVPATRILAKFLEDGRPKLRCAILDVEETEASFQTRGSSSSNRCVLNESVLNDVAGKSSLHNWRGRIFAQDDKIINMDIL